MIIVTLVPDNPYNEWVPTVIGINLVRPINRFIPGESLK